ncbi:glycosyltransferase [Thermomonospora umbrina]|uniref:Vancomycin aglycone glucosyltransferase n=1 Tax=Thermomonospora umbrina TaxID=111806 RepID=A0A3D9T1C7_9ACTN|nr:glycosyltransferase [Thermomonospora umbrina]REE99035.1 vancomycin aglycone glucosyltransferase [Thermomonospora umbrina]
MRVLLSVYGSRGDVEPMAALAVRLRELGVESRVCAPPDEEFAERLAGAGVTLVPAGLPVREFIKRAGARPAENFQDSVAALLAAQYEAVAAAAEGCDLVVATGLMPASAAARSVAERMGIAYMLTAYCPWILPSPHHRPFSYPTRPLPEDVTDNRALWELDRENMNVIFGGPLNEHRRSIGLPPVESVRDHVFTDRPLLAADPTLAPWRRPADLDVVQTGAWIIPDDRPLSPDLMAFLDAGAPPVYVGFGSMSMSTSKDAAQVAIEAVRGHGRRAIVSQGWADLGLIDDKDDCFAIGEANHQALFGRVAAVVHHGGGGTTTKAALAGAPQVIVPQVVDQPYWGRRVTELGIGATLDGPTPTTETLSAALDTALALETRSRASGLAGEIRTDGAATTARLILDTLG